MNENVSVVTYRIKSSREYQPVGRMEGHFGRPFNGSAWSTVNTRNLRCGHVSIRSAQIGRPSFVERFFFKETDSAEITNA